MKATCFAALAIVIVRLSASAAEDDGGFHSIAEYQVGDPSMVYHIEHENIDDLFDTRGIAKELATQKRVRLFRTQPTDTVILNYYDLEHKRPLNERLAKLPIVELTENAFRPMLSLAVDFNNYGDRTICGFQTVVAVIIGGDEPDFILLCCFKCHNIHIVRRPTSNHPMPHVARVGMSPELEKSIFSLTQAAYPDDKELQLFKLAERTRSKTPVSKQTGTPKDNFLR